MFTGIVEKTARVLAQHPKAQGHQLVVSASFNALEVGESIAVNGVCLTLLPLESKEVLCFDLSPETLNTTTLGTLTIGDEVNLERAMRASTRFGGHYVTGHVDRTAEVDSMNPQGDYLEVGITGFDQEAMLYLLPKGSVTVDGVSLTINSINTQGARKTGTIKLMLVPHTLSQTNLGSWHIGQHVNIEFDYFTRIVAHQLQIAGKLNCEIAQ